MHFFLKSKIKKKGCKIFLFLFLIFRLHFLAAIFKVKWQLENGCWKVTAEILERNKNILHLVYFTLKKCISSGCHCL